MKKNEYRVLGIMSGTSLDGIDSALLNFKKTSAWEYEVEKAETIAYSSEWQKKLREAVFYSDAQLRELNINYTSHLAEVIGDFKQKYDIQNLDAVCSHGHTIKHEPQNGFTLQIGNLPRLANLIDETLVCDFRVQDVELGGQGAPLVPIGDELLFRDYEYCLNLGGFANISSNFNGKRLAYDICAVNTVMNYLAEKLGKAYDRNGEIAAGGTLNEDLLAKLSALEFYDQKPPKSLGIEWVNQHIYPLLQGMDISTALHTYAVHAADQIAKSFNNDPNSKVLVTGGGAFNGFLMERMKAETRNHVYIPSPELVNYKEALIFGFLGILRLREETNVLGSVTGASRDHCSGKIFVPE